MEYNEVKKVVFNELDRERTFTDYDTSYIFTTENISGYIPCLEDMDVLSVCSSGDHYFNSVLYGAKRVDLFDINRLTLMLLKLKRCAIINLDRDVFFEYFGVLSKKNIFDYNIFCKFSKYLDEDCYEYFNYLYKMCNFSGNYLYYATSVFFTDRSEPCTIINSNDYLSPYNYRDLRVLLGKKTFDSEFTCCDVNVLRSKVNRTYDAIFLSNIQDYQNAENYIKTVLDLKALLKPNGKLYFAYCYYGTNNYNAYNRLLEGNNDCSSIYFQSIYADRIRPDIKDKVLVLSKYE